MYLKEDPNSTTFSLFYEISDSDAEQQNVPLVKRRTNAGLPPIALNTYKFSNILAGSSVSLSISDKNIDKCSQLSDVCCSNLVCFGCIKTIKELASFSMLSLVAGSSAGQSAKLCVNSPGFPTAKLFPDL